MTARSGLFHSLFSNYRWIPWLFVAAFLVVFAVNGGLVYFASASWPGLVTDDPYDAGQTYNRVLAAEDKEARLGWTMSTGYRAAGQRRYEITVSVRDSSGRAVENVAVTGQMVRPVGQEITVTLTFVPQGGGSFLASVALPRAGQWDVFLAASRGSDVFHGGRRLLVSDH